MMNDEADIRFVDPHPEGRRCNDDLRRSFQPTTVDFGSARRDLFVNEKRVRLDQAMGRSNKLQYCVVQYSICTVLYL